MAAAHAVTTKAADVLGQCRESMLDPGLADLFEAVGVAAPPPIRYMFCGMTGWSIRQTGNQSRSTAPEIARGGPHGKTDLCSGAEVKLCQPYTSPTTTSGPGTVPTSAGITADLTSPLATLLISIGRILAVIEIPPTTAPASAGRPMFFANPSEISNRPSVTWSDRAVAS